MLDGTAPFAKISAGSMSSSKSYFEKLTNAENWKKYISMPRGAAVPFIFHERERIVQAFANLWVFGETQDKDIVMGDEHLGNLFVEADGTPGFLDFQCK